MDALTIEAWLKNRAPSAEANSLLCAKLFQRREARASMLNELAAKRGCSAAELRRDILLGQATMLTPEEYAELVEGGRDG